MKRHMWAQVAVSLLLVTPFLGVPPPTHAQVADSVSRGGGGKWILLDAVGYGGLGFGLGLLANLGLEDSGVGPVQPPEPPHTLRDPSPLGYGFPDLTLTSFGPDGTTLAVIAATTVAGTVAGALIGHRAQRIIAEGGHVSGIHRAAVLGGAIMAGGTVGALISIPLIAPEGENTRLGSDEQTFAFLVGSGAALGALLVLRYRHELGSRKIAVTPVPPGRSGYGLQIHVEW